jgi:hypothetical protein
VHNGFSRCRERYRVPGSECGVLRGAMPITGFPRVVRQRFDDTVRRVRMLTFDRIGYASVQRDAFSRKQLGVDRLASKRVTKCESVGRLLDDKLRRDELFHERQHFTLVVLREYPQQVEVESTSSHRRNRRNFTRWLRQGIESTPNCFDGSTWDTYTLEWPSFPAAASRWREVARDQQRLERLFDEERIPLREPVQKLNELGAEILVWAEDRSQHRADVIASEPSDGKVHHETRAFEICDEARETWTDLLTPVRERDDDLLRRMTSREVEDQLEAGVVAPVDILEREHHGLRARERRDRLRERMKETTSI